MLQNDVFLFDPAQFLRFCAPGRFLPLFAALAAPQTPLLYFSTPSPRNPTKWFLL